MKRLKQKAKGVEKTITAMMNMSRHAIKEKNEKTNAKDADQTNVPSTLEIKLQFSMCCNRSNEWKVHRVLYEMEPVTPS